MKRYISSAKSTPNIDVDAYVDAMIKYADNYLNKLDRYGFVDRDVLYSRVERALKQAAMNPTKSLVQPDENGSTYFDKVTDGSLYYDPTCVSLNLNTGEVTFYDPRGNVRQRIIYNVRDDSTPEMVDMWLDHKKQQRLPKGKGRTYPAKSESYPEFYDRSVAENKKHGYVKIWLPKWVLNQISKKFHVEPVHSYYWSPDFMDYTYDPDSVDAQQFVDYILSLKQQIFNHVTLQAYTAYGGAPSVMVDDIYVYYNSATGDIKPVKY